MFQGRCAGRPDRCGRIAGSLMVAVESRTARCNLTVGRVNACSQRGGRHRGLESRTWRIQPLAVVQQRRGGIDGKDA